MSQGFGPYVKMQSVVATACILAELPVEVRPDIQLCPDGVPYATCLLFAGSGIDWLANLENHEDWDDISQ